MILTENCWHPLVEDQFSSQIVLVLLIHIYVNQYHIIYNDCPPKKEWQRRRRGSSIATLSNSPHWHCQSSFKVSNIPSSLRDDGDDEQNDYDDVCDDGVDFLHKGIPISSQLKVEWSIFEMWYIFAIHLHHLCLVVISTISLIFKIVAGNFPSAKLDNPCFAKEHQPGIHPWIKI